MGKHSPIASTVIILAFLAKITTAKRSLKFHKVSQVKDYHTKPIEAIISTSHESNTVVRIYLKSPGASIQSYKVFELKMSSIFNLRDKAEERGSNTYSIEKGQFNTTDLQGKFYRRLQWGLSNLPAGGRSISIEQIRFNFVSYRVQYRKKRARRGKSKYYTRIEMRYLEIKYIDQKDGSGGKTQTLEVEGSQLIKENDAFEIIYLVIVVGSLVLSFCIVPSVLKQGRFVTDKIFPFMIYSFFSFLSWIRLSPALNEGDWISVPLLGLVTRSLNLASVVLLVDFMYKNNQEIVKKSMCEKGRGLMWIICTVWLALCLILPYFGLMIIPLFSILVCIDIFCAKLDNYLNEIEQYERILVFYLVSILHHTLVFYLFYWSRYYRQFETFPVNFFLWILPNLVFLPLAPIAWYLKIKNINIQNKKRNRKVVPVPLSTKTPKKEDQKSNRSKNDSTIRELNNPSQMGINQMRDDGSRIEGTKIWMEFLTPSLLYFKKNCETQQEFHCVPHFDIKKLRGLYHLKKMSHQDHPKMLNYDPQNVFTSLTNNYFTITKQYDPSVGKFVDLCFIRDIRSRIQNNHEYAKTHAAGRETTAPSLRIRIRNTEAESAYIIKKVWIRNQVNKNYIALAHKDRRSGSWVSLISVKNRKVVNRMKLQYLEHHCIKSADLVIMKDGSFRLFAQQMDLGHMSGKIGVHIMKKKFPKSKWKGWSFDDDRTHARTGILIMKSGGEMELKPKYKDHLFGFCFLNMSFYDDLMCITYQYHNKGWGDYNNTQHSRESCRSNGLIVGKITLEGKTSSEELSSGIEVVSNLTQTVNRSPFNHKIDYSFFVDSTRLAFLMKDKLIVVDIKEKKVIDTITIANYFDYCRFRNLHSDRNQYFISALLDRSHRRLWFSLGRFHYSKPERPSMHEHYLTSTEMVDVTYYVSGVINLAGLVKEEKAEEETRVGNRVEYEKRVEYAKPQGDIYTNRLEVFSGKDDSFEDSC